MYYSKEKVKVISPDVDTRAKGDYIESRNGLWLDAIKVKHSIQILSLIRPEDEVVAIDELQFFDGNIAKVITKLMNDGKKLSEQDWNLISRLNRSDTCRN